MLLSKLLPELTQVGIGIVGTWEINAKKGITLGDPKRSFPNPVGERYQVDCNLDLVLLYNSVYVLSRTRYPTQTSIKTETQRMPGCTLLCARGQVFQQAGEQLS
jgi:hypothetical protein